MTDADRWDERYRAGDLPWDTNRPDRLLMNLVIEHPVPVGPALDLGCGTGTNAIWLARRGFDVTAVDVSALAIEMAQKKAEEAEVQCRFVVADCVRDALPGGPFAFVFDRGCFHSFDSPDERTAMVANLADHMQPGGLWFSLLGSTDAPPRDIGPPRRSARDIVEAVEPRFEILRLVATHFDSDPPDAPPAWACLMRRRTSR